jgi:hypothetical protein
VRPDLTEPNRDAIGASAMILYITAILTVAALFYLAYAMIRPEAF